MNNDAADIEFIRSAVRRLNNSLAGQTVLIAKQVALIAELEAQHQEDDRQLALLQARAVTDREVCEKTRKQLVWTQAELAKAEAIVKSLEIRLKEDIESVQRRSNAIQNAMQGQLDAALAKLRELPGR